jgi:AraC-like DNA-binding protein
VETIQVKLGPWRAPSDTETEQVVGQLTGARSLPVAVLRQVAKAFRVRTDVPYDLTIDRRRLPNASVADFSVTAMILRRLPFSRPNAAHIVIVRRGVIQLESRTGDVTILSAGDMCVVTQWSDYELQCVENADVTHLLFAESRLRARGVQLRGDRIVVDSASALRDPIVALVGSIVARDWSPTPSAVRHVDRALEDLVVGLLLERGDSTDQHEEQRAVLRARAIDEIASRHRDRDLNPSVLAKYLGVSLRHLQRAFEHSGTSAADQIALRRAASAAELLTASDARALTVSEVARVCGFGSPFELRSALRARYGKLPSAFRAPLMAVEREKELAPRGE